MGTENLFNTPREGHKSASELLEGLIQKKELQKQNKQSLTEANKLSEAISNKPQTSDFTLESAYEAELDQEKTKAALEKAFFKQGQKNKRKRQFGLKEKLVQEGLSQVYTQFLFEMVYDGFWLNESLKFDSMDGVAESFCNIMSYVEESCSGAKVPEDKQNVFLQNVNECIKAVVEKASKRIADNAELNDLSDADFELTDTEKDELDGELSDLGRDEIVDAIKAKVVSVIQDEKEKGQQKAEIFKELDGATAGDNGDEEPVADDNATTETEDDTDDDTEAEQKAEVKKEIKESMTLESAFCLKPASVKYTAPEAHVINSICKGGNVELTFGIHCDNLKSFVSGTCKCLQYTLNGAKASGNPELYKKSYCTLSELDRRLSDVPAEEVDDETASFIQNMVRGMVYTTVNTDVQIEDIPTEQSVFKNTIPWNDLLVNLKVNISNIKEYCLTKACPKTYTGEENSDAAHCYTTLDDLVTRKKTQMITKNIGDTLFEALMIGYLNECNNIAMESNLDVDDEGIEDSALVESLLSYTVLETLDTLGIYKFRMNDINIMKEGFVRSVSEGKLPFNKNKNKKKPVKSAINKAKDNIKDGDSKIRSAVGEPPKLKKPDKDKKKKALSIDKDKPEKLVRINTLRMKRKKDNKDKNKNKPKKK